MTLEQAIEHCEEKAEELKATAKLGRGNPNPFSMLPEECLSCAEEHEQLAGWLKELKKWRSEDREKAYRFEHVTINIPKMGEADGWIDRERMLLFSSAVTCEWAIRQGWTWEEDND